MAEPLIQPVVLDLSRAEADIRRLNQTLQDSFKIKIDAGDFSGIERQVRGAQQATKDASDAARTWQRSLQDAERGAQGVKSALADTATASKQLANVDLSNVAGQMAVATRSAKQLEEAARDAGYQVSNISSRANADGTQSISANFSQVHQGLLRTSAVAIDAEGKLRVLSTGVKAVGTEAVAAGSTLQSGVIRGLQELSVRTGPAGDLVASLGTKMASISPQAALAAGGIGAVVAAVAGVVVVGNSFENLSDQITRATGATGAGLNVLRDDLSELLGQTDASGQLLAATLGTIKRNVEGLDNTQLKAMTKSVSDLLDTFQVGPEGAQQLTQITNLFGVSADETTPLLEALTLATTRYGGSLSTILSDVTNAGPVLKTFGFSPEELALLSGRLQQVGSSLSEISPGLKHFAADTVATGGDARAELGHLIDSMQAMTDRGQQFALASEAFGPRAAAALVDPIVQGRLSLNDFNRDLADSVGALQRIDPEVDSLGDAFTKLKNAFVGEGGNNNLVETFKSNIEGLIPIAKLAGGVLDQFGRSVNAFFQLFDPGRGGDSTLLTPRERQLQEQQKRQEEAVKRQAEFNRSFVDKENPRLKVDIPQVVAQAQEEQKAIAQTTEGTAANDAAKRAAEQRLIAEQSLALALRDGTVGSEEYTAAEKASGLERFKLIPIEKELRDALGVTTFSIQQRTEAERLLLGAMSDGTPTRAEYALISQRTGISVIDLIGIEGTLAGSLGDVTQAQQFTNEQLRFTVDLLGATGNASLAAAGAMTRFGLSGAQAASLVAQAHANMRQVSSAIAGLAPTLGDSSKAITSAAKAGTDALKSGLQDQSKALSDQAEQVRRAADDQVRAIERQATAETRAIDDRVAALQKLIKATDLLNETERNRLQLEEGFLHSQAAARVDAEQRLAQRTEAEVAQLLVQAQAAEGQGDLAGAEAFRQKAADARQHLTEERGRLEREQKEFERQATVPAGKLAEDDAAKIRVDTAKDEIDRLGERKTAINQSTADLKQAIQDQAREATDAISAARDQIAGQIGDIGTAVADAAKQVNVSITEAFTGFAELINAQVEDMQTIARLKAGGLDNALALILDPENGLSAQQRRDFLRELNNMTPEAQQALERTSEQIDIGMREVKDPKKTLFSDTFGARNETLEGQARQRAAEAAAAYSGQLQETLRTGGIAAVDVLWQQTEADSKGHGDKAGASFGRSIGSGISSVADLVTGTARSTGGDASDTFAGQGYTAGSGFGTKVWQGMDSQANSVSFVAEHLARLAEYNFTTRNAQAYGAGVNIAANFVVGITDEFAVASKIVEPAVTNVANAIANAARRALGINSPSTVAMEIAGYWTEGLVIGLEGGKDAIARASSAATSPLSRQISANAQLARELHKERVGGAKGPLTAVLDRRDSEKIVKAIAGQGPTRTTKRPYRRPR